MTDITPLRLPDAETLGREVAVSLDVNWDHTSGAGRGTFVGRAQRHLNALTKLMPVWVPVPEDATIPAGVRYRCERDAVAREAAFSRDISAVWRDGSADFYVASTDLDKLTYPGPDADAKAVLAKAADLTDSTDADGVLENLRASGWDLVRREGDDD